MVSGVLQCCTGSTCVAMSTAHEKHIGLQDMHHGAINRESERLVNNLAELRSELRCYITQTSVRFRKYMLLLAHRFIPDGLLLCTGMRLTS